MTGLSFLTFGLIAVSSSLFSAVAPISGLAYAEINRLRQNAPDRCRATFATESGNPDDPSDISRQDPDKVQGSFVLIDDWLEKTPVVFPGLH